MIQDLKIEKHVRRSRGKFSRSKNDRQSKLLFIIFIFLSLLIIFGLYRFWSKTSLVQDEFAASNFFSGEAKDSLIAKLYKRKKRAERREVKALYLTAYSAGSSSKLDSIIELINSTELNAIVIDIKDYSGLILYDSNVDLVNKLETEDDRLGDVRNMIKKLHKHDIYVIARQTVFQDPILAEQKPEWAIKSKNGGLWRDHKGLAWVDPTRREVWEYNMQIAKEAVALGFDEINFDYVRFPSDGNMSLVVYTNAEQERYEVMNEFFKFLDDELTSEPVWVSIDMFGFVMERHDGMSIGQRLEDAVDEVDYICPMMYPSHYPSGHLDLVNPADHPEEVFENGMKKGMPYFTSSTKAQVRPWIQAFNLGAVYDAEKIRAQIDVIEKYTDAGWLMWNASNRYTDEGLRRN